MARQIGNIQEHRKRWRIRLPEKVDVYVGRDGRPFYSKQEAQFWLNQIQGEIAKGVFDIKFYRKAQVSNRSFTVYANQWLTQQEKRYEIGDISPYYIRDLRRWVSTRFIPFFGPMELQDIKGVHLSNFYFEIAPTIKPKTRHNILSALHKLFKDAVNQELVNVAPKFPPEYSRSSIPDPDWKWADVETQNAILRELDDDAAYFVYFLMAHALRPSEGRALQHQDVNLENGTITIRQTFSQEKLRHTKTKKIRTIPVDGVWAELYKVRRNPDDLPTAFVFTYKGKQLTEYWARNKWRYARKRAGFPELNLYGATRHSLASQAVARGESLYLIQRFLGHTDPRTTERYSHVNVQSLRSIQRHSNVVNFPEKKQKK